MSDSSLDWLVTKRDKAYSLSIDDTLDEDVREYYEHRYAEACQAIGARYLNAKQHKYNCRIIFEFDNEM